MRSNFSPGYIALLALSAAVSAHAQPTTLPSLAGTATIGGAVNDDAGNPVSGAIVSLASELPAVVAGQKQPMFTPFRALAITAADGTFSASNLPSGLIKVCVQVPQSNFVEVCRWPLAQTIVTVTTGQSVSLPAVGLIKGFPLQIRVNDASGILASATASANAPRINPGVFSDNHLFVHAQQVSQDSGGYTYQVIVPFDLSLHVSVSGTNLSLTSGGAAVAGGNFSTPITVASGTTSLAPITVGVSAVAAASPGAAAGAGK